MNKKIIYVISASAMLVVAISISFIFSSKVPTINTNSQQIDTFPQANNPLSVTQQLAPVENLIPNESEDNVKSVKVNKAVNPLASPDITENLIFSAEPKKLTLNPAEEKNKTIQKKEKIKQVPKAEIQKPKAEVQKPKAEVQKPKAEVQKPKAEVQKPKAEVQKPKATTPIKQVVEKDKETVAKKESAEEKAAPVAKVEKTKPIKKNELLTHASLEPKADRATVLQSTLHMDGDQVTLLIEANQNIEASSFILEKPNRIVFDLKGTWAVPLPRVISNRMVKDLRLGKTKTHTRLVFDLKVKPKSTQVKQISPTKTQLIFK